MPSSTLKNKGQITLPSPIRKQIHAEKGDIFDFQLQADDTVLMIKKQAVEVKAHQAEERKKDLSRWLGAKPSVFKNAQEVDSFIRKQRDLWS